MRIVWFGDAVHKMTPNLAFRAKNAIASAGVLANLLHEALAKILNPDTPSAEALFGQYQMKRIRRAEWWVFISGRYTRAVAWGNWIMELVERYVMPLVGVNAIVGWFFSPRS